MQNKNEDELELAQFFETEELEQRLEFAKWSGEATGGYRESSGVYVEGSIKFTF